jgi:hypothetical protein
MLASFLQEPQMTLGESRTKQHGEESMDSGTVEIALQHTTFFSLLPHFSR